MANRTAKKVLVGAAIIAASAATWAGITSLNPASAQQGAPRPPAPAAPGPTASDDKADANEVETPIQGTDLDRASAAALAFTKGGRVTETEVNDEESHFEVEVTLDDGSQVDVQLDETFNVVGSKAERGGE